MVGGGRPRLSSHDEGVPAFLEGAGQVGGGGGRPRVNSTTEEQAEVEIGSLMMEVHAAPSLQLFSGRGGVGGDGRASPLSRSVEDISSQLDRLTRTFHVASPPQATSPLPTTAAATFHSDARQADRATFHGGFGGCGFEGLAAARMRPSISHAWLQYCSLVAFVSSCLVTASRSL